MSPIGLLAWGFYIGLWSLGFTAQGLQFEPIASHKHWLFTGGLVILIVAGVYEGTRKRRNIEPPA